ncbi:unnamed protein product [Eruca vesicaria subsp. sativa]|uniref:Uncharacterized protein n=1 Tax=Eruca vesicaria subsp. sativa TaxID=29727 RepID=A0ABC8J4N7_ERUVS|nr:unnamed protein product [Eruca vesicaria subsp. sativa]
MTWPEESERSLTRICFLSGLTGEYMMILTDVFPKPGESNAQLEPSVFAAIVPNSADEPILKLMKVIMSDSELLTGSGSRLLAESLE